MLSIKFSTILLLSYSLSAVTNAQTPDILWQKTIGGNSEDKLRKIVPTADGGFAIAGSSFSNSSDDKSENRIGGFDYWIIKLDADGNIQWENTIGGEQDDYLTTCIATDDSGFFLGGYSASDLSGDKDEHSRGGYDYWVVKLDAAGIIEWQHTIGGSQSDELRSVLQSDDEGYLLAGNSQSGISGDKTDPNEGGTYGWDYWVVKLDATGAIVWQNTIGGSDNDRCYTSVQDASGDFWVGGNSFSDISGDKDENSIQYAPWFVKLDPAGSLIWQETIDANYGGEPVCALLKDNGNLIFGLQSSSASGYDKTVESYGGTDHWIMEFTQEGELFNQWGYGGAGSDYLTGVTSDSNGGMYIVGYSGSSAGGTKSENSFGGTDYWIIHTDSLGNILWDKIFGGIENDYSANIILQPSGQLIVAGYSASGLSGNKDAPNLGYSDYWVITMEEGGTTPCSIPPDGLYADFISSTTAKLHWDADPGAIKYRVGYKKIGIPGWIYTNAVTNSKNLFDLDPGSNYVFRVRALCGLGLMTDWSSIETFATSPLRLANTEFSIFPNPAKDMLTLTMTDNTTHTYRIFGLTGSLLAQDEWSGTAKQIDVSSLTPGTYILEIEGGQHRFFVIQ